MQALRFITAKIDAFSERSGRVVAWLTLVVVAVGAFTAIARYVDKWLNWNLTRSVGWFIGEVIEILFRGVDFILGLVDKITPGEIELLNVRLNGGANTLIELQWYLFAAIFLLGAAYTLKHSGHVRVDVLYDRMGHKWRCWVNLGGHVLFLIPFCVFMIWITWPYVVNSWSEREMSPDPGGLPRYLVKTLLPLAFLTLLLQGVGEVIRQVVMLVDGEPSEDEPEEVSI